MSDLIGAAPGLYESVEEVDREIDDGRAECPPTVRVGVAVRPDGEDMPAKHPRPPTESKVPR